jgi:hypothetical protein
VAESTDGGAMSKISFALAFALVLAGLLVPNGKPFDLLSCPGPANYAPDKVIRVANYLIGLGEETAYGLLVTEAKKKDEFSYSRDQQISILSTLLWRNEVSPPLRRIGFGSLIDMPENSMNDEDWQLLPLCLSEGVPFLLGSEYVISGKGPESGVSYLSYCKNNGKFRQQPYPIPSRREAERAVTSLFASEKWRNLKWEDSGEGWSYQISEERTRKLLLAQVQRTDTAELKVR